MPFMEWSEKFNVGLKEIDTEHQAIITLLNALHDCVSVSKDEDQLHKLLDDLDVAANAHWAHEERLMQETNFPGTEAHTTEHVHLRAKLNQLREHAAEGRKDRLANEILAFMKSWVMGHISYMDRAFVRYVIETGLRTAD